MAKRFKRKKGPFSGLITFGILYFIFSNFSRVFSVASFLLVGGLALLVAFAVGVMASGLDTSKNQKRSPKQVELAEREEREREEAAKREQERAKAAQSKAQGTGNPELDALLESGAQMLSRLRTLSKQIDDQSFLPIIQELENNIKQILKVVYNQPSDAPLARKFMNYYLPTTLKMIEKYAEYEALGYESTAVKKNKQKIIEAVKVINQACHKQLDIMYKDDILDINTDINTLERMLKRDGLVESELEKIHQESIRSAQTPVREEHIENMDEDIQDLERALKQDGLVETEWERIQKMNQEQTQTY